MKHLQARALACFALTGLIGAISFVSAGGAAAAPASTCANEGNGSLASFLGGNDDLSIIDIAPLFVGFDLGSEQGGTPNPNESLAVCLVVYDADSDTRLTAEVDRGDLPDSVTVLPTTVTAGDGDSIGLVHITISGLAPLNGSYPIVTVPPCAAVLASC